MTCVVYGFDRFHADIGRGLLKVAVGGFSGSHWGRTKAASLHFFAHTDFGVAVLFGEDEKQICEMLRLNTQQAA
jgi:hypothetical protein